MFISDPGIYVTPQGDEHSSTLTEIPLIRYNMLVGYDGVKFRKRHTNR